MRLPIMLLVVSLATGLYCLDGGTGPTPRAEAWSRLFQVVSTSGVAANSDETPRHLGQEAQIGQAWRSHRETAVHFRLTDSGHDGIEPDAAAHHDHEDCARAIARQDPVPAPACERPTTYIPPPCYFEPVTMLCFVEDPCTTPCSDSCTYECTYDCSVACTKWCTYACTGACTYWCTGDCTYNCTQSCTYWCTGSCTFQCTGECTAECTYACTGWCTEECTFECTDICTSWCTYECTGWCTGTCTFPCTGSCTTECTYGCTGYCTIDCTYPCTHYCTYPETSVTGIEGPRHPAPVEQASGSR